MVEFIIGAIASLFATIIYEKYRSYRTTKAIKHSFGWWVEIVPDSTDCQYSVGEFYFNRRKSIIAFDGTNYNNGGTPRCHWETISGAFDASEKKYFYTYRATLVCQRDIAYYGFGVIEFDLDSGTNSFTPTGGHYISANVDSHPMSHTMESMKSFQQCSMDGVDSRRNIAQLIDLIRKKQASIKITG
ncbi:MAG: hypothetical protein HQL07_15935 [Nitrospirae bacterium]|nr:hypothetical protein [Magnetococcales bacterium]HAT49398.1 hypothetical protein [Alphaproteobacteria bacterium]